MTMNEALGYPPGEPSPELAQAGEFADPLWLQNLAYPAQGMRVLCDAVWPDPGVLSAGALAVGPRAAGGNLSVDVAPGLVVVAGDDMAAQGSYLCRLDNPVNVALAATPGTGQTRIDLICARVYDAAVIGGGRNDWSVEAVTGIAASVNPQPPAVPRSAQPLAHVTVAAGTAAITAAMIADRRNAARGPTTQAGRGQFAYTAGGIVIAFPRRFSTLCRSVNVMPSFPPGPFGPFVPFLNALSATGFTVSLSGKDGVNMGTGESVFIDWIAVGD